MENFNAVEAGEITTTADNFLALCDTFELLADRLAPLYLLFFATSSSCIMDLSFSLYFYWGSISTCIFSLTGRDVNGQSFI
jgi:hypothetical protein